MDIIILVGILLLGIFFIVLEIFIFPGFFVPGIAGAFLMLLAIYFAYINHSVWVGHTFMFSALFLSVIAIFIGLRPNTWKKISLATELEGNVATSKELDVAVGDEAVTVSRLAPMGSIKVNGKRMEAKSKKGYIDENQTVRIVSVSRNQIVVEETTNINQNSIIN